MRNLNQLEHQARTGMTPRRPAADSTSKPTDVYLEQFDRIERDERIHQPPWLFPFRKSGMARFAELGFPTLRHEDWRFTNVAPIAALHFRPALEPNTAQVAKADLEKFAFAQLPGTRLVFVDGHYAESLSLTGPVANGCHVASLARTLRDSPALIEPFLGRLNNGVASAFASLNAAFFQDGAFIHIATGRKVVDPIQLLFVSTGRGDTVSPRNLIVAGTHSELTIVESYVSLANEPSVTNAVSEFIIGDGAKVEHLKFQDESEQAFHVAAVNSQLGSGSSFLAHSIATGGRLSRNNIRTILGGTGVECILNGLYVTRGEQLADHHMVVEHAQPHCASHEYYNGILEGKSRGVFHGRILVRKGAQKTDAKQTNKNLLLSDDATVDTKPQLEIYADDVKCTHGATIGQLDDESIFYLRSRGIGAENARRMLIHAFAGEIIDRIQCELVREELDKLVWDRLEQCAEISVQPR